MKKIYFFFAGVFLFSALLMPAFPVKAQDITLDDSDINGDSSETETQEGGEQKAPPSKDDSPKKNTSEKKKSTSKKKTSSKKKSGSASKTKKTSKSKKTSAKSTKKSSSGQNAKSASSKSSKKKTTKKNSFSYATADYSFKTDDSSASVYRFTKDGDPILSSKTGSGKLK